MKKQLLLWLGILLSAVFLYLAVRDLDFSAFFQELAKADTVEIFFAFLILMGVYVVRTFRWQAIISTKSPISLWQTFVIQMIGLFGNNVFPARAGEIIRAFLLRKEIGVSRSFALGTIAVERISDVAALMGILILALFMIPPGWLPEETEWVRLMAAVVLAAFIIGMLVVVFARAWMTRMMERILCIFLPDNIATGIADRFNHFAEGLEVLRKPSKLILVMSLAFLDWILITGVFYMTFDAVGMRWDYTLPILYAPVGVWNLGGNLPLAAAMLAVGLVHLGMLVPSSPGYVGTYEFFLKKALLVFAVPIPVALAGALLIRLQWYLFETISGFVLLWSSQMSVKDLFNITKDGEAEEKREG